MSATATSTPPPAAPKVSGGKGGRTRFSFPVVLLIIAGALLALSAVRAITGAQDVTSAGQISAALAMAVPIGLAGLGGLWSERAGCGQHRPRRHDDPRHLLRCLGRPGRPTRGSASWPESWAACSAVCCTPSPPSPSASTTSSPVSPSTSWPSGSRRTWPSCGSTPATRPRRAAAPSSRHRPTASRRSRCPASRTGCIHWRSTTGSSSRTSRASSADSSPTSRC